MTTGLEIIRKPNMSEGRFHEIEQEVIEFANGVMKERGLKARLVCEEVELSDVHYNIVEDADSAVTKTNLYTARILIAGPTPGGSNLET
jgi:hypothetical protein